MEKSLDMIELLRKQQESPKDFETQFLLSDQVYMKAIVPPTDKVCLWLGVSISYAHLLFQSTNTNNNGSLQITFPPPYVHSASKCHLEIIDLNRILRVIKFKYKTKYSPNT